MVEMIGKDGVKTQVAPEAVTAMLAAGFTVVTAANSEGPLPKSGLNREQRKKVSAANSAQSLMVPSLIADSVKAGTLSTLEAKVKDFLLKRSRNGGNYVACQVQTNFQNNLITFCILDNADNPKMEVGNLITLHLQTTDNEAIRSGVEVHKVD